MPRRTTIGDFQSALESIDKLLEKYKKKEHEWLKKDVSYHVSHAIEHGKQLMYAIRQVPLDTFQFEDLQSLACRSLMALEVYLEQASDLTKSEPARDTLANKEKETL